MRPEAELFIGLKKQGYEVHIMTAGSSFYIDRFKSEGLTVVDFHPTKRFDRTEIQFIRNYIEEQEIDIVHLFNGMAIVNGIQAAKKTKAKIVLYRGFAGHINWYDPSAYFKYLHPAVDRIMCNSIGVKNYLDRQLLWRKYKAVCINKGHDLKWYDEIPAFDLNKLGFKTDSLKLVCVANNRPMKGISYLLKAFNFIPADRNIDLLLIGKDLDIPEHLEIIKDNPLRNRIHFLGFREDALSIVRSCDVFVLPSLWGESITKAVIESMALKTCPIITDIPGNVELVDDGENGLVVPKASAEALAEAILKIYLQPEKRSMFAERSYNRIGGKLNISNTISKVDALYKSLF